MTKNKDERTPEERDKAETKEKKIPKPPAFADVAEALDSVEAALETSMSRCETLLRVREAKRILKEGK